MKTVLAFPSPPPKRLPKRFPMAYKRHWRKGNFEQVSDQLLPETLYHIFTNFGL